MDEEEWVSPLKSSWKVSSSTEMVRDLEPLPLILEESSVPAPVDVTCSLVELFRRRSEARSLENEGKNTGDVERETNENKDGERKGEAK